MLSRKSEILEGIAKLQTARSKAIRVRDSTTNPEIRELAVAIDWLSFGAQEIGLGLTEDGRTNDLP